MKQRNPRWYMIEYMAPVTSSGGWDHHRKEIYAYDARDARYQFMIYAKVTYTRGTGETVFSRRGEAKYKSYVAVSILSIEPLVEDGDQCIHCHRFQVRTNSGCGACFRSQKIEK
jgi:hypothetical protein